MNQKSNFPLYLTLFRLIISPLFFPFLLQLFLPGNIFFINMLLALLFLLVSLTDFFDGYLARLYNNETFLGKTLDHIADKVWIGATLIVLVAVHKIWFFWVVLLIGRELFVAGLRQLASEQHQVIHVSWLGKCKTFIQILSIAWIIANPSQALGLTSYWNSIELLLILVSVALSYSSAYSYYRLFVHKS